MQHIDHMSFRGSATCCGTHAISNALGIPIDIDLFELSAGTPFGIKSGQPNEGRLLTTFRDPNIGMDQAAALWGIQCQKFSYQNKSNAGNHLKALLAKNTTGIVVGPTDMGYLSYIPLSNIYAGVDHYIHIKYQKGNCIEITDSECVLSVCMDFEHWMKLWHIEKVLEAQNQYTFRVLKKISEPAAPEEIAVRILANMEHNLHDAETVSQGCYAFFHIEQEIKFNKKISRIALMYDLAHLLQRKLITIEFLQKESTKKYLSGKYADQQHNITACLFRQAELISTLMYCIENYTESTLSKAGDMFHQLGVYEKELKEILCF